MDIAEKRFVVFVVVVATVLSGLIYVDMRHVGRLRVLAETEGCEYLGRQRYMPRVMLWNCNGEIVHRLVPREQR